MNTTAQLVKLRKDRRLVRALVILGVSASLAANGMDSAGPIDAGVAMWPPLALLATLEVLTRIPVGKWYSTLLRILSTLAVGVAAGWLSYFHMASFAAAHNEHGVNAYVWPLSVDGLMTVAAVALVEIGARIRMLETADAPNPVPVAPNSAPVEVHPVAAVLAEPSIAPVSPAPAGRLRPGALGLMVEKPMPPVTYRTARSMPIRSVLTQKENYR